MGCTSSKQDRGGRRQSQPPYSRSHSMPVHYRGPSGKVEGSGCHMVELNSSTLRSIWLDSDTDAASDDEIMMKCTNDKRKKKDTKDEEKKCTNEERKKKKHTKGEVEKAKAWSDMIESRIPKTLAESPFKEQPETINAWELMEGLEEAYADADAETDTNAYPVDRCSSFSNASTSPKPLWMQIASGDSIVSDFDPDVIFNFRKALDELSPQHQLLLRSPEPERITMVSPMIKPANEQNNVGIEFSGIVKARVSAFQEKIDAKKRKKCPPNGEGKVVLYFTSLRGIRKTYEDCCAVKVILQGYSVRVDERDVSMHSGFKDELNEILGAGLGGSRLPRVFANGKYLGGAEEVQQMHEAWELGKALEECEFVAAGKRLVVCEACGDMRFVPCEECSGSCKVFVELEGEEGEEDVVVSGFRRCQYCNENGLVRCTVCC